MRAPRNTRSKARLSSAMVIYSLAWVIYMAAARRVGMVHRAQPVTECTKHPNLKLELFLPGWQMVLSRIRAIAEPAVCYFGSGVDGVAGDAS